MKKLFAIALLAAAAPAWAQFGNATKLRGKSIASPLSCENGQALTWDAGNLRFKCAAVVAPDEDGNVLIDTTLSTDKATPAAHATKTTYYTKGGALCALPSVADGGAETCTGTGGGGGRTLLDRSTGCQAAVAATAWHLPAADAPAAACITGTDSPASVTGALQFADSATQSAQDSFILPADWAGTLKLYGKWRANVADATKEAQWAFQTKCVADGETASGTAWNAAQTVTSSAKAVANQEIDFSEAAVTITGCAAGEQLYLYFYRNPANDDLGAPAELLRLQVTE